ncbi:OmpA family protein [Roseibium sp. CAU 1637]|uniref:OmpA family protein n=1 Tax=Roseibium limicola TaxID=2816037 RepID=A0A939J454_9HYPH|nr:OmpA family protein [Roseibium limicola]MBO0344390.1 OmpA family protein [Roseibium limicola]
MRAQAKQVRHEEEEESAFVSMTDMTVGFLFIMMILLAFFASQARDPETVPLSRFDAMVADRDEWRALAETREQTIARLESDLAEALQTVKVLTAQVSDLTRERDELKVENAALTSRVDELEKLIRKLQARIKDQDKQIERLKSELERLKQVDPLEAYLSQVSSARREVLTRLRDAILADFPDLKVELSEESDALRFQGEGLFASGSPELTSEKAAIVSRLAARLDEILPCFTLGEASRFDESCNPSFAMVEAVQIEGHTDNLGSDQLNRNLSAARANSTFFAMTGAAQGVMRHLNLKRQPVLSVAAYGPDRPVTSNETPTGRSTNRRIDLRFIMVTPKDTGGIRTIREALEAIGSRP